MLDTDPRYACAMVDSVRVFYDRKVEELHKVKIREEFNIRKDELARYQFKVDSVRRRLSILGGEYGVMELNGQSEGISAAYFQAVSTGKNNEAMEKYYWNIAELAPEYKQQIMSLESLMKDLSEAQTKYHSAYRELTKVITYSVVVTPPFIADKKSWPKRSVIVLMSVFFTLIMAMVVIGVIENRSNTKPV